ncbi:MAG: copper chaperone PCu(A)C [Gammaproteobacteria bacterium]
MKIRHAAWPLALVFTGASACEGLVASATWIRAAPPGSKMLAGYGTLRNDGPAPLAITAVEGAGFGHVMLHETVLRDGQARMIAHDVLEIGPGGTATLAPGGLHLMLMHPAAALGEQDRVVLEFRCGDAHTPVTFVVRRDPP